MRILTLIICGENIHENGTNELKFCVDAADVIHMLAGWTGNETGVSINRTGEAEIHSWNLGNLDFTEWLSVCTDIRSSLRAVDDAIPERYPNRMIADLSDLLADTSAVAIDVGQHMVWSYQSFHNQKNQKLLFSGGHGAMGYALPAAIRCPLRHWKASSLHLWRRCLPDEYSGIRMGEA